MLVAILLSAYFAATSSNMDKKAASFVECLSHMAVDGPGDSFMDYTKEWISNIK